jgi:hypothetical protein
MDLGRTDCQFLLPKSLYQGSTSQMLPACRCPTTLTVFRLPEPKLNRRRF